jgi:outer membrane protein
MRQAGLFLPTITLGPTYGLERTDAGTSSSNAITADASASGSLSDLSSMKSAGLTAEQRGQLLLNTRQNILLSVATTYYDVLRFQQQAQVLEYSVQLQQERLRDQQARVKIGAGKPLDVAQSRAELAGTRAQLTQARTDAINARSTLARLMGVSAVTGSFTDAFALPDDVPNREVWQERALSKRHDLIAENHNVDASHAALEGAIRQYLPSVSINFNYFLHTDPASAASWTAGVSVNVPIFSALRIEADIRRAWSRYRQADLSRTQTRRQVVDDVQRGWQSVDASRSRLIDLQMQVGAAQDAFNLSQRAYELGAQSNLDRLILENTLRRAQLDLVNEQYNEKITYLNLVRAAGELDRVLPAQTRLAPSGP